MHENFTIRVYNAGNPVFEADLTGAVELGRQSEGDPAPYAWSDNSSRSRIVIASRHELDVSRKHLRISPLPNGALKVENTSRTLPLSVTGENRMARELSPQTACNVKPPLLAAVGVKAIRVEPMHLADSAEHLPETGEYSPNDQGLQSLHETVYWPADEVSAAATFTSLGQEILGKETIHGEAAAAARREDLRKVIRWLQASLNVFHSAVTSADFFDKAAGAVVEMVGLDSGCVLLWTGAGWRMAASSRAGGSFAGIRPSQRVLKSLLEEKRTFWQAHGAAELAKQGGSMKDVTALVAAPLLDRRGEVIGAIYGDRRVDASARTAGANSKPPITEFDAMLLELVACAVAAGLARLEQQQAALKARVQFEQFFTTELSRQLARQPDLLEGRDAQVSVLVCDIRGFSRISERMGAAHTLEWINDVLDALSAHVLKWGGVLVDYIGDELMAMWGAPTTQPDHAQRACGAALDMLAELTSLNERWESRLGEPTLLGIGVNSGVARVGNIGSRLKFKYGPLGNTVNLASRVQGATKYLRRPLLITGSTQSQLDDSFLCRRLCQVRVINIEQPVDLFELAPPEHPDWEQFQADYEAALAKFERGEYHTAVQMLGGLLHNHPQDGPARLLLSRASARLLEDDPQHGSVWELPGK